MCYTNLIISHFVKMTSAYNANDEFAFKLQLRPILFTIPTAIAAALAIVTTTIILLLQSKRVIKAILK